MKQERSIDELLEVMLDNINKFEKGLCLWNTALYAADKISEEEWIRLRRYIKKNRPWFSFYPYYWPEGELEPRLKWIRKHIKKLRKNKPEYYPPL